MDMPVTMGKKYNEKDDSIYTVSPTVFVTEYLFSALLTNISEINTSKKSQPDKNHVLKTREKSFVTAFAPISTICVKYQKL